VGGDPLCLGGAVSCVAPGFGHNESMDADSPRVVAGAMVTGVSEPACSDHGHAAGADDVLVLPLREDERGSGIYPEGTIALVKQLRAAGVKASYVHPSERRLFEGRKGAVADAVYTVVLGVLSAAGWDGLKGWFGSKERGRLRVTFGQVDGQNGDRVRWWEVEGNAAEAVAAIDRLVSGGPRPGEDGAGGQDGTEDLDGES
jgi:hypothetical protein